jgi:hypothetical protein
LPGRAWPSPVAPAWRFLDPEHRHPRRMEVNGSWEYAARLLSRSDRAVLVRVFALAALSISYANCVSVHGLASDHEAALQSYVAAALQAFAVNWLLGKQPLFLYVLDQGASAPSRVFFYVSSLALGLTVCLHSGLLLAAVVIPCVRVFV